MSSLPRNPTEPGRDRADGGSAVLAGALLLALGAGLAYYGAGRDRGLEPGAVRIFPEMVVELAPAPMPAIASPPEPVAEPPPEIAPEPEPQTRSEPVAEPEPAPEPVVEPIAIPPPAEAPARPMQARVAEEGNAGAEEAVRAEWLSQLRRRIEESKYYPGAARYARETGTVLLRVEIGSSGRIGRAEILENSGSALLAEGALGILRRAAEKPLGTNTLPADFRVDVPITYRIERR